MFGLHIQKLIYVRSMLLGLLLGLSALLTPLFAQNQCVVEIEDVNVVCNYANGTSTFTASVEVSWSGITSGPVSVTLAGQTQTLPAPQASGSATLQGFTINAPGFGYAVVAGLANGSCQAFTQVDAIACTPECPDDANGIGGFVWKDENYNGLFDGETGQPNVKVEAYDCAGTLAGTAFSNANGLWSITGLEENAEYRLEFTAQQGMNVSFYGEQNPSDVQFAETGNCGITVGFTPQINEGECTNPDNTGQDCVENFRTLDWSEYDPGANPFPFSPYVKNVDGDQVYWARTNDDATDYTHRVFYDMLGGEEGYYYLEMDADDTSEESDKDVGVVFSLDRPVQRLSFTLLDIDLEGNAIDRVSVQGFLGGKPVDLSASDLILGSSVNVLDNGVFEGTATVPQASTNGNVRILFEEAVDQVAITYSAMGSAAADPNIQAIGISNISWCSGQVPVEPQCTRIMDWMAFQDNDEAPLPFTIDGTSVRMNHTDADGLATSSGFKVDNDQTPLGGQRGYWPLAMDAEEAGQTVETGFAFDAPVEQLSFSLLGIDQEAGSYRDQVEVRAFLEGVEIPLSLSDLSFGGGNTDGIVEPLNPNEYTAGSYKLNAAAPDGNVYITIPSKVDSFLVRLKAAESSNSDPGPQMVGISDLRFCICLPAPIQIGDLAWIDENGDGVQNACEPALPELPVQLYSEAGTLLATTVTDEAGRYRFTKSGSPGESWEVPSRLMPQTSYYILFGTPENSLEEAFLQVGNRAYKITAAGQGEGNHPFMNDSEPEALTDSLPGGIPDALPFISYTTGEQGQANLTLDAGFQELYYDLALEAVLDTALSTPPFLPGQLVTYTVTLYNQGLLTANNIRFNNYLPIALDLEDGGPFHQTGSIFLIPELAAGDSVSTSITYRISDDYPGGTLTNAYEILQSNNAINYEDQDSESDGINGNDPPEEDDYSAVDIVVDEALLFDLSLEKTLLGQGPFVAGNEVTFEITVTNEGILQGTDIQIGDRVPEGLTLNDDKWEMQAGNTAVLLDPIPELNSGESYTTTISFLIVAVSEDIPIVNQAEILSFINYPWTDDEDSTPDNGVEEEDDQDAALIPTVASFDLALEKEVVSDGPYFPGDQVTFKLTVTNEGSTEAKDIFLVDYIPSGLALVETGWEKVGNRAELEQPIEALAPGASASREITFFISPNYPGASITNSAEIMSAGGSDDSGDNDSTPDNGSQSEDDDDAASIVVEQTQQVFDLSIKKEVNTALTPGPYFPGQTVTFNITVTNEGNLNAFNIQVADYIPAGLELADLDWSPIGNIAVMPDGIPYLEPGESKTLTIDFTISSAVPSAQIENYAEIYAVFNGTNASDIDSEPGNGIDNGEDDEDVAYLPIAGEDDNFDLSLEKRVKTSETPGPFAPGDAVTFELEVTNEGTIEATDVQIADLIPDGLTLVDNDWVVFNGNLNIVVLDEAISSIPGGESVTVDISFEIDADFAGNTLNNRAEISSASNAQQLSDDDSTPGNANTYEDDYDNELLNVVQSFDLALAKEVHTPGPYEAGQEVTYTITVYNQGMIPAYDIQVFDYYPTQQLVLNDSSWEAVTGNILKLSEPIASLAPGESVEVPITFTIKQIPCGAVITNCAEIGGAGNPQQDGDSVPGNGSYYEDDDDAIDITTTCTQSFDLSLSKTVSGSTTYSPGSTVTFNIEVTNEGEVAAENIKVQDYIPLGLILIDPNWSPASSTVATLKTPIPSLAPGNSVDLSITFAINSAFYANSITNKAEIKSADNIPSLPDEDSTPGNGNAGPDEDDYDGATIYIQQESFDLALSKSLKSSATPGPFLPGSDVVFSISITNQGNVTAENIKLREYFPAGLEINDPDWMAVGNIAELIMPIPSLAPGAMTSVEVKFKVGDDFSGNSLTNYAEVGSAFNAPGLSDQDSTPGNGSLGASEDDYDGATISVIQQNFDLALHKQVNTSATPGPFTPGGTVTFLISVTNQGDAAAQSVQLRDYIPLGLELNDPDWTQNGNMNMAIYEDAITDLQPGSTASVSITFDISSDFTGDLIRNYAEIGAFTNGMGIPDEDSTPGNGSAGASEDDYDSAKIDIVIAQNFDLALSKTLNSGQTPGPFLPGSTVTFTITVTNEGSLEAQGIQLHDYIPLGLIPNDPNWSANGTTASLKDPIPSLAPGASVSRDITFLVSPAVSGGFTVRNFAEIGGASNDMQVPDDDSTPGNGSAGPAEDDFDDAEIYIIEDEQDDLFDLALHKNVSFAGPYQPGDLVTFDITVTNEGDVEATDIELRDYVPQGLMIADLDWSQLGNTVVLKDSIPSLAPNASTTVSVQFAVAPDFAGDEITNFAEIKGASNGQGLNDEDSTPDNGFVGSQEDDIDDATISVSQDEFDLALSKSVSTTGPFVPGSMVSFQLTIYNQGSLAAQYVEVQDFVPNGLVLVDDEWTLHNGVATLNDPISSIPAGQTASLTIDFVVDPAFTGGSIHNYAEILNAINPIGLGDADSTPGNGSAGEDEDDYDGAFITISQESDPAFDLALIKEPNTSATPGPYGPGGQVSFTITVINQGDFDAYKVEVTDYIPDGLSLNDGNWTQTASNARRTIPGPIAPGESVSLSINFQIDYGYMGAAITNFAEISFADDDQNPSNTPPTDVDSPYDSDSTNDAGGAPNSPADNATMGNGMGSPGSTAAVTDEDDHDPAMILLNNCENLSAGFDGALKLCLSCDPAAAEVDLFAALGGSPSPGGTWTDVDYTGVNLMDPTQVDVAGLDPGTYEFDYTVGGMGSCAPQTSTVTLTIEDIAGYACNDQVNLNFGTGCEVEVTPDMVLEGSDGCMDQLQVNLLGPTGQSIGNTVTGDQIGQYLVAEVIDPYCGFVCWGTVYVNDVTAPGVVCPTQDVNFLCGDIDSVLNNSASLALTGEPVILDNCSEFSSYTFTDTEVGGLGDCEDQRIERVFTVTDPAGNTAQCTQEITISNPSLSDVVTPPAAPEVACDANFAADAEGYPLPEVTGFPEIQGVYGDYLLDQTACNLGATYEDTPFIEVCGGTNKFVRTWTIVDWCASSGENVLTFDQVIKIGDVEAPQIGLPSFDPDGDGQLDPVVYSTSAFACTASFDVPMPTITDNCSSWEVEVDVLVDQVEPQYNQYGQFLGYDTIQTVFATVGPGESPFVAGIPIGCHTFRYKATDDCNNYTVTEAPFCVEDQIEPTAICDDSLNISLGGQGVARLYAESVDEGSNDNCGVDTLLVRRLYELDPSDCSDVTDYYSDWGAFVDFNCCDVNQSVTVELKVIDEAGNENICWLNVLIEDKTNPFCFAPADVTTSCSDLPASFSPTDSTALQSLFGAATADDNCFTASSQELDPVVNLDACGAGTIIRRFQAVDGMGNTSSNTCQQVITISEEFDYTIRFPKDAVSDCGLPDADTILLNSSGCDQLSVNVEDQVFTPTPGSSNADACYTIMRRYRVINHCEYDGQSDPVVIGRNEDCDNQPGDEEVWVVRRPDTTFVDRDNDPNNLIPAFGTKPTNCDGNSNPTGYWRKVNSVGYWEYTQIIKVLDGTAPQINFTQPDQFCSTDQVSCNASVQYPFTIVENCSPDDLDITVELDAKADGSIDFDVTQLLTGTYPNYTITGEYPIGSHQFVVTVEDGCGGNTNTATLPFDVVDCAAPTFTCLNGLSFGLQELPPETDIDGDGEYDVAGAGIWASDFHTSVADCSDDTIAFSINLPGETPDINQTALYFTCEDTGLVEVEVYFWDSAFNPEAVQPDGTVGGPNWDFCEVYLYITDNDNLCDPVALSPMMAGVISRENQDAVESVQVSLSGQMDTSMMTNAAGTYEFADLPMGQDYTLTPFRDDDHRNGVTTFDLILIQQHLLGISPLQSPYKRIAADANKSGSITTLDMIHIQQLILGITTEFPNNTAWRFVDEDFVFPVPANPWFSPFPESITINNLDSDMMSNDFVAIKVGDVNNTAQTTAFTAGQVAVEDRNFTETFRLQVPDKELQPGASIELPFYLPSEEVVEGYQFTLEFDPSLLSFSEAYYGLADEHSLGLYAAGQGLLTASWYQNGRMALPRSGDKAELFRLRFQVPASAQAGLRVHELFEISSRYTSAEAYGEDGSLQRVQLDFIQESDAQASFRLLQNQPNPFRELTNIGFELPEAGTAQLSIFDLNGRLLRTYEGAFSKGYHEWVVRRDDLSYGNAGSSVLYYQLRMGEHSATKKMLLVD